MTKVDYIVLLVLYSGWCCTHYGEAQIYCIYQMFPDEVSTFLVQLNPDKSSQHYIS